jgi:hypothetical protein
MGGADLESQMRWWRRIVLGLGLAIIVLVVSVVLIGCTTTVTAPSGVADPVTVLVLDHGHTPSLLMPTPEGRAVRYAYGDWAYYAKRERHLIWNALPAMAWPTPAGVGRGELEAMPRAEVAAAEEAVNLFVEQVHTVVVERDRAEGLRRELEAHFRERWDDRVRNEPAGLTFVPHDQRYTLFRDSNWMVGQWLREMGAETSGPPWALDWEVEPAE